MNEFKTNGEVVINGYTPESVILTVYIEDIHGDLWQAIINLPANKFSKVDKED